MSEIQNRIDITKSLIDFSEHLKNNRRIIFSAKFGDGKSFFLKEFQTDHKKDYEFITLYPVNYQIAENRAIFEYIKRDILIQMIIKGMISPDIEIPQSLLWQFYIMNNSESLLGDLLQVLPLLGLPEECTTTFLTGYNGLKSIKNIFSSFKRYKASLQNQDSSTLIERYLTIFKEEKGSPYEMDLITYLILNNIEWYKKQKKKEIVLVIEDLDRLDPGHLFRILNVFSAHIDRVYQLGNSDPTDFAELKDNKFGFDHIITVFDNHNAENTFHYFYGPDSDYNGYISKFLSSTPFYYSIKELARMELYTLVKQECKFDMVNLPQEIQQKINALSVRDIIKIKKNYHNRIQKVIFIASNQSKVYTDCSFTKLLSILLYASEEKYILRHNLQEIDLNKLLDCLGGFACCSDNILQHQYVRYERTVYSRDIEYKEIVDGDNVITDCVFKEVIYPYSDAQYIHKLLTTECFDIAIKFINQ